MDEQRGPGRHRLLAVGAASVGLALSVLLMAGVGTTLGHSQLVSSSPGAGQVVAASPTTIRLIFSEPIEGRYTSLDLLDGSGTLLLQGVGSVDPADPNALVVQVVDPLSSGVYSINWRAVSAADGHSTNGFLTFGVGAATLPAGAGQTGANEGDLHAGHSGATASLEVFGKTIGDGGAMLAFGLWLFGVAVVRPVRGRMPSGLVLVQVVALVASAVGAIVLIWVGLVSLPATTAGLDVGGYLFDSRIGQLLSVRAVVAIAAWVVGLALAGRTRGGRGAAMISTLLGVVGAAELVLIALMGHSAAFTPPIPLAIDIAHLGSAGILISGVAGLALLTGFGSGPIRAEMRDLVPRFSALALASGGLLAGTGIYAAWLNTHDFTSVGTAYSLNLAVKVAVVIAAFALGAFNLFDGGRDRYPFGLSRRVAVEAALAFAILVLTANLTSGSPTAEGRPIAITPVPTTATTIDAGFAVQPALPGPNQLWVALAEAPPTGATVSIVIQRLDASQGTSTIKLARAAPISGVSGAAVFTASGLVLAPDSEWDATVIVADAQGTEIGRARFDYAFGTDDLTAGAQIPLLDPALLMGILLLGGGLVGFAFWVGGGRPPLVETGVGRRVLAFGSVLGSALGVLILLGPR